MRDLVVFASLVALGLVVRGVLRIPPHMTPAGLLPYLFAHGIFILLPWIASQRFAYTETGYARMYVATAIPLLFCLSFFGTLILVSSRLPVLLGVAAAVTAGLFYALRAKVGGAGTVNFLLQLEAAAFIAFGLVAIASLAHLEDELWNSVRLFFGLFWLSQGLFLYLYCAGCAVERYRAAAIANSWLPSFLAFVAWTWLAIYLGGLHSELVKQNDTANELLEIRWLSWAQELFRGAVQLIRR